MNYCFEDVKRFITSNYCTGVEHCNGKSKVPRERLTTVYNYDGVRIKLYKDNDYRFIEIYGLSDVDYAYISGWLDSATEAYCNLFDEEMEAIHLYEEWDD